MIKKLDGKLKKLDNGKWTPATSEEFAEAVQTIKEVVQAYGWWNKKVHPYGYGVKLEDLINSDAWTNFSDYTGASQHTIIAEVNGTIDILNSWLDYYESNTWAVVYKGEIIYNGTRAGCDEYMIEIDKSGDKKIVDMEVCFVGY